VIDELRPRIPVERRHPDVCDEGVRAAHPRHVSTSS
jgi:hypothetical protein